MVGYFRFLAAIAFLVAGPACAATQPEILKSCEACHGPGGNSQAETTPRLNGQRAEYFLGRIQDLSARARNNSHADVPMFTALLAASDADKKAIAAYFAGQPPTAPKPGPRAAEGKRIFENGLPAENVIACNLCHGANGEGYGTGPRLAGQHAAYLNAQLTLFHLNFRGHSVNGPNPNAPPGPQRFAKFSGVMNANTQNMTQSTMDALASYLAAD